MTTSPPHPTSQPIPSTPINPAAGVASPSCAEQPANPTCPRNATSGVLCPPVRLPAPLDQTPTGSAMKSGGSSGGNVSVTADDSSRGTGSADGTSGGGSAQDTTQQQAAAAVTLGGMWLSDNGSTVYMCMGSRPGDGG